MMSSIDSGTENTPRAEQFTPTATESKNASNDSSSMSASYFSSAGMGSVLTKAMPWLEAERSLLPHQEAAILLEYARDVQDLNGSNLTLRSRNCYILRHKLQIFVRAAAWGLLALHVFERPLWTYHANVRDSWDSNHEYPSFGLTYLQPAVLNALVCVCLAFLWMGVALELVYKRHTSNAYLPYVSAAILTIKSVAVLVCIVKIAMGKNPTFSVSPIEALMCLLVEVQYDNNIGYIRRTVPKFCVLMLVLACVIITYTAIGFLIFNPESEEATLFFPTMATGVWNMLMVLNASNWPPPMIPALEDNRLFCIYFYAYIVLVDWGLLNLVLGFVYLFFQQEQKGIFDMQEKTRVDNKAAAFRILDVENKGFLTYTQADDLLKEMFEFYEAETSPPTAAERYELILVLDIQSNLMIDENDFSFIMKKCLNGALKVMRAKKNKFIRYVRANIMKQNLALLAADWTPPAVQHGAAAVQHGAAVVQHGVQSAVHTIHDVITSPLRIHTNSNDISQIHSSTPNTAAALARAHARASAKDLISEIGVHDSRVYHEEGHSPHNRLARTMSTTMKHASAYAGEIDDPKLLELYRTIETEQLAELNLRGGLSFSQRMAMVGMQVDTVYFDIVVDTFMLIWGIIVLLDPTRTNLIYAYLGFALIEMVIKLVVKGWFGYWVSKRTGVDGFVTLGLLAFTIADASVNGRGYSQVGSKALILLRTLCYPRNLYMTNGFKEFRSRQRLAMAYALNGASHFTFLLLVLVVMMYAFSGIGVLIFGGAISRTGPGSARVAESDFGVSEYYPLNFNDMPSGVVTMFTLLTVNNMHVTASGFTAAYSQWAEVFFALFYAFGVLMMLNVLTAVFVDQFTGYMSHLAIEKQQAAEQRQLEEEQKQMDDEEDEEVYKVEGEEEHERSRGAGLSSDSVLSTDHELRRNTFMNAAPAAEHARRSSFDAAAEDTDGYINKPRSAPLTGVLFNIKRPSYTASAPPDAPPKTDSPVASTGKSFGRLRSKTHLGLLAKMLTVDDTVTVEKAHPVLPPVPALPPALPSSNPGVVADIPSTQRVVDAPPTPTGPHGLPFHAGIRHRSASLTPGLAVRTGSPTKRASMTAVSTPPAVDSFASPTPRVRRGSLASRPRSSTGAAPLEVVAPLSSTSFKSSIFASTSDRQVLDEWVKSHMPRPRRQTAANAADMSYSPGFSPGFSPQPYPPAPPAPGSYGTVDGVTNFSPPVGERKRRSSSIDPTHQHVLSKMVVAPREPSLTMDGDESSDDEDATTNALFDIAKTDGSAHNESPFRLSAPGGTSSANDSNRVRHDTGDFELNSVTSTPMKGDTPPSEGSHSYHSSSHGSNHAQIDAAINTTQEELVHLRGEDQRRTFLDNFVPRHSVRTATKSLNEWMYGANQISPAEKAAVLIQFARDGEEHSIFSRPRGLACFRLRTSLSPLFKVCSFLFAVLKFFQRPAWTYTHAHWSNNSTFPTSGLPQLDATVTGAIKLPLLLVLLFGLVVELGYKESNFTNVLNQMNPMRLLRWVLMFYCCVQILMVIVGMSGNMPELVPLSSCGCILYVLWFNRRSMHKFRIVLRVLPRLSLVLILFLLMVLLFAGFGPYLFNLEDSGKDDDLHQVYFDNFRDSTWSVFVAITSSNYPNQIMPAYREAREVFLYFFAFISIGAFGLLNLILVIVLVEFQKASQLAADIQRATRQVLLMRAYEVLDPDGVGHIERAQIKLLLDELYQHYSDFKKAGIPKGAARDILIDILDVDGDGFISVQDFLYFLDVTRIKLSQDVGKTFLEIYLPGVAASKPFQWLKAAVQHRFMSLFVDVIVAVMIIVNLSLHGKDKYHPTPTSVAIAFTVVEIIAAEAFLKILVGGISAYKRSFRNRIDFIIAFGALICLICAACYDSVSRVNGFTIIMRVLLMVRLFLFPRNLRYWFEGRGLKRFARLLRRILAKTLTLSIVFSCTGFFFASIGVYAFGGTIGMTPASNPHYDSLIDTSYGQQNFYALNFNDFMSACITLFSCLHVSDFDTIATGFASVTNQGAKVYFTLWYVVGTLLMLNILKSFFLGEFLSLFLVPESAQSSQNEKDFPSQSDFTAESRSPLQNSHIANKTVAFEGGDDSTQSAASLPSVAASSGLRETYQIQAPPRSQHSRQPSSQTHTSPPRAPSFSISHQQGAPNQTVGRADGQSEYDEELYTNIEFTRHSTADQTHSQDVKYYASTAQVKNLDAKDREMLRLRIKSLANNHI